MTSFVLRDVHLVEVLPGTGHGAEPLDVRIEDGRVEEVGSGLDRPAGVPELAGEGRWLIPGLWDMHVHLGQWALTASRLDLAGTGSVPDALARVAERLRTAPDLPLLVGWGHRSAVWPQAPTVGDLDAVSGDRPVVLISGDGHHAWLNTAALDLLSLPRRDGVVEEAEWFAAYPRLTRLIGTAETGPAAYLRLQREAAALGIVGVVDLEYAEPVAAWPDRTAAGGGLLRIRASCYADTLEDYLAAGLRTGDPMPGGDPRLSMGPLKIISDGSLNTRTAWCCEPYVDRPGRGAPNLSAAELRELLTRASAAGLEVATHAIGDAAVDQALRAYADTGATGSIEHAQLMRVQDVRRLAQLGLRASVQPAHLLDDRDVTEQCWSDRAGRCFMFRSMLDAGVEVVLGSDAPIAPLDPWLAMAAAVHRSADERPAWHAEQAITPQEALAASVDGQGTVHAGMPADLVLLDADPLAGGPTGAELGAYLRSMPVAATWILGDLAAGGV